jgi:thymidylate synthase ThyX
MANNTGKKFGGRVKGTPNKTTSEIRDLLKLILENEIKVLPETIKNLKPNQKADIVFKLIQFVLPKPEINLEVNNKLNEINVIFKDEN